MNIPRGTGWQQLRAQCLATIPEGSVSFQHPMPLHEWRQRGAFRVTASTRREIMIEAAAVEIGNALLSDVEYLLDHAAEHHATCRSLIEYDSWHSPGWGVVTTYYWAFFLAMAITRLVGQSSWFLDRIAVGQLRGLSGSSQQPAAGAFYVTVGSYISGTNREMTVAPSRMQFHDAVWGRLCALFEALFKVSDQHASGLEYRMLWCFANARLRLSPSWPSIVRNAVNYRPGCAYREVLRKTDIDMARYLRRTRPLSLETVISEFEDQLLRIPRGGNVVEEIPSYCRLLLLFTLLLMATTTTLHREVVDRNSLDHRWLDLRRAFLRSQSVIQAGATWPFS